MVNTKQQLVIEAIARPRERCGESTVVGRIRRLPADKMVIIKGEKFSYDECFDAMVAYILEHEDESYER